MTIAERKAREFKQREADILAAALKLLDREDWQSVTIDQIAAKAEIGKGTVYKHFESKDQIYALLTIQFARGLMERLRAIDPNQPVLEFVDKAMVAFWKYHEEEPKYRRLLRFCRRPNCVNIGERMRRDIDTLDEDFLSIVGPVLARGIKEGVLIDKPLESLLLGIHAVLFGMLEMEGIECMCTSETPQEELFAEIKEFALRGISRK